MQRTENYIFKNILDELIKRRIVKNDAEFCRISEYPSSAVSLLRQGKRPIPDGMALVLLSKFNVNPGYLTNVSKEMFLPQPTTTLGTSIVEQYQDRVKAPPDPEEDEEELPDDFNDKEAHDLIRETLRQLHEYNKYLMKKLDEAEEDKKTYRQIIDQALKDGYIKFVKPNKIEH